MPQRHLRGRLRLHVREVLLELPSPHAVADDVEEGEDARAGAVDDPLLEVGEVPPAGASRVHHRRDAHPQREAVGVEAVVAGVGALLARAREDVDVHVHEARGDVETGDVHDLEGLGGIDLRGDGRDLPAGDRHVAHGARPALRVDDVPAAEQQVVLRLGHGASGDEEQRAAATSIRVFMAQALPEAWRFAEKRASRYSPRLTSPGHLVAGDLPAERVVERVAVLPGAADPDGVAVDRAPQVAGHEVALVGAVEVVAALPHVEAMGRDAGRVLDPDVPGAGRGRPRAGPSASPRPAAASRARRRAARPRPSRPPAPSCRGRW